MPTRIFKMFLTVMLLLAAGNLYAAPATLLNATLMAPVGIQGDAYKCYYSSATSVDNETLTFKVDVPWAYGAVTRLYFKSASTSCAAWLSESDNQTMTSVQTLAYKDDIDVDWSPADPPGDYNNMDSVQAKYLYFTIQTGAGNATGPWDLVLVCKGRSNL